MLNIVLHIVHFFNNFFYTSLLQGYHSDFHYVPLVWEHLIPALIDLIEGRGTSNTSEDEDGAFIGVAQGASNRICEQNFVGTDQEGHEQVPCVVNRPGVAGAVL